MTAYYNELEPFAARWLENLATGNQIAPGTVDARSIEEVTARDIKGHRQAHFFAGIGGWSHALRRAGVPDDVGIWTGSCPCQPFSSAGQGLGVCDARHLWPSWFALIEKCRPGIIFGEQVASADGLGWLDLVFTDLERCGYTVGAADICAAGVGAPHNRSRLYFVAHTREGGRAIVGAPWLHDLRKPGDDAARRRANGIVANAAEVGREGPSEPRQGRAGRRQPARGGDVGDAQGQRRAARGKRGASGRSACEPDGSGDDRALGDAGSHGDLEHVGVVRGDEGQHEIRATHGDHAPVAPGAVGGFWADAEWVLCRDPDGPKWRPVEPGAFPLATGVPGRVGLLRGYGNAINIEAATEFICASLEAIAETERA